MTTMRRWGGRASVRAALYMATVAATRANPAIRAFYQRLVAAGKRPKMALTACMRKLLVLCNALSRTRPLGTSPWPPRTCHPNTVATKDQEQGGGPQTRFRRRRRHDGWARSEGREVRGDCVGERGARGCGSTRHSGDYVPAHHERVWAGVRQRIKRSGCGVDRVARCAWIVGLLLGPGRGRRDDGGGDTDLEGWFGTVLRRLRTGEPRTVCARQEWFGGPRNDNGGERCYRPAKDWARVLRVR